MVKHLASVEFGYFGDTFGRPSGVDLPWWTDEAEPNDDLWATPKEAREWVVDLYRRAWAHAAVTFEQNDLDAVGHVKHWGNEPVTLHWILVHVATESHHHAGYADILREMIDGAGGFRPGASNLPEDGYDWPAHVARCQPRPMPSAERGPGPTPHVTCDAGELTAPNHRIAGLQRRSEARTNGLDAARSGLLQAAGGPSGARSTSLTSGNT